MIKNPRVVGALVVGFALVAGAYTISNFGKKSVPIVHAPLQVASVEVARNYIAVADKDGNGIEDWREEFASIKPLVLPAVASTTTFTPPTTITDQIGIQFFESVLRAKSQGGVGPTEQEVIKNTAERLKKTAGDVLYGTKDIVVVPTSPEAIRTYANTMAQILTNNNAAGAEDELTIVDRALKTENEAELAKLDPIINMYRLLREQSLTTPVPDIFIKQHLDLINVYQALYLNLKDMKLIFDDPVVALMRVQRYQDDATGLGNALINMYSALVPYVSLFTENDPAVIFVLFSPDYQ